MNGLLWSVEPERRSRFGPALFLLVVSAGWCSRAGAQDPATAEALFDEGRALMAQERYADACPKFEASQRLDPAIGTLLNLGTCLARLGQAASAWTAYREAASLAKWQKQPEREAFAREQAAALEPELARLTVRVAEPAPETLELRRSGSAIPRDAWGSAIPVDPGEWVIEASAPGRQRFETRVTVQPKESMEVVVPALEPLPEPVDVESEAPPARALAAAARPEPQPDRMQAGDGPLLTALGIGIGGLGVIGLGIGGYFGLRVLDKNADLRAICAGMEDDCPAADIRGYNELRSEALEDRTAAWISASVGAASLIGGVVLLLVADAEPESHGKARMDAPVSPYVDRGGAGLRFAGSF